MAHTYNDEDSITYCVYTMNFLRKQPIKKFKMYIKYLILCSTIRVSMDTDSR
jgi:hypothetical protein